VFRARLEDWEEELWKKKNCMLGALLLLEKYRGPVFWDPDTKLNFTVYEL